MSSQPTWIPFVTGIIGVLGTLGGGLGGQWLAARRDDLRWKREEARDDLRWQRERSLDDEKHWREQRILTYNEILGLMRRWLDDLDKAEAMIVRDQQDDWDQQYKILDEHRMQAEELIARVLLVGSKETSSAAHNALTSFRVNSDKMIYILEKRPAQWTLEYEDVRLAQYFEDLVDMTREELKVDLS